MRVTTKLPEDAGSVVFYIALTEKAGRLCLTDWKIF